MLVVMKRDATKEEIDAVVERIKEFGITPVPLPGAERTAIGTFGSTSRANQNVCAFSHTCLGDSLAKALTSASNHNAATL